MKKIVLDPGHGGKDPGAVGPGGTKEKDVALAVAKYLQQELSPIARISLARETDEYRDLWERSTLANSIGADYFVSIHCNAAVNRTANGTETLIYGRGGEAEKLAAKVQAKVVTALGTRDRGIKVRPELHVLARTKMPAILVELAFISNPQEEKLLADPDRQREAARAIAQGIADYLGVRLRDNPIKEANEEVESTKVLFEGKTLEAFLKDGKTYVEVRKLCEALGLKVIWHADTKLVEVQKIMLKQKLTSRKFWVAVTSAAFIILSEGLGLNVDSDLYWKLVALALGYIFGEAAVDVARSKNASEGNTDAGTDN